MAVRPEQVVWINDIGWKQPTAFTLYESGRLGVVCTDIQPIGKWNQPKDLWAPYWQSAAKAILAESNTPEEAVTALVGLARMTT